MGLGTGSGLGRAPAGLVDVLADLVGQDIIAKSISLSQASGSNAVLLQTAGARLKLSASGTTDYLTSDGATILTAAGTLNAAAFNLSSGNFNAPSSGALACASLQTTGPLSCAGGQRLGFVGTTIGFVDNGSRVLCERQLNVVTGIGGTEATCGGILNVQSTPVSNVSTGETDLFTYSMPASTMTMTNRGIGVTVYGSNLGSATTKTLRFYFGAAIQTVVLPVTNAGDWELTATVIRTGASAQRFAVRLAVENDAAATVASFTITQGTAAQTETGAITVKITGQDSVGSGAITANLWNVSAI